MAEGMPPLAKRKSNPISWVGPSDLAFFSDLIFQLRRTAAKLGYIFIS
jgi:hypothetical protein